MYLDVLGSECLFDAAFLLLALYAYTCVFIKMYHAAFFIFSFELSLKTAVTWWQRHRLWRKLAPQSKAGMLWFKMWMWLWKPDWKLGPQDGNLKMNFRAAFWRKDCTVWWTCRKLTLRSHWGLEATCCILYFTFMNHDLILSVMP